ncbi:MAG TPA: hypothetical protein VFM14_16440 [Gemmatimonadales bacterium]|nr:hypothetical protein [Gemmatimonadales bacterium]
MKKIVIGCLVLLGILGVAAGAASYIAYRKVSSAVSGFAELGTVPTLERSVRNRRPYAPPASGEVTERQVERLVGVQQAVRTRLGERAGEFERKYKTLLAKDSATVLDVPELVSAYRDLAAAYVDAKRAQVEALNNAGLSLEEYRWIRSRSYAAVGMPMMDFDVSRIVEDIKNGRTPTPPPAIVQLGPTGSPATQKLVEGHRKVLEQNAGIAFFGL